MELIKRYCNSCNVTKLIDEFVKDKHDSSKYAYKCKSCRNKSSKEWRDKNPEKVKIINAANKEKRTVFYNSEEGRKRSRISWLKKAYNLSIEEYELMIIQQNGQCAICGATETKDRWRCFAVDHNHITNKVRQLLCWKCNSGLGLFNDNKELLTKAITYLQKHESAIIS